MRAFPPVPALYRDQLEADVRSAIERIQKDAWARAELARSGKRGRERKALERLLLPMMMLDPKASGDVQVLLSDSVPEQQADGARI